MFKRDFLVFLAHLIEADANMRHHEIDAGKGFLRIGGEAKATCG
jgi:thiamine phosphate synthase YjbQ (UPF0047 family)